MQERSGTTRAIGHNKKLVGDWGLLEQLCRFTCMYQQMCPLISLKHLSVHGTLIDSACKIEHYNEDTYLNKFNKVQAGVKNIHLHITYGTSILCKPLNRIHVFRQEHNMCFWQDRNKNTSMSYEYWSTTEIPHAVEPACSSLPRSCMRL